MAPWQEIFRSTKFVQDSFETYGGSQRHVIHQYHSVVKWTCEMPTCYQLVNCNVCIEVNIHGKEFQLKYFYSRI